MYHITLANTATYCGSLLKRNLNGRQQLSLYAKVLYTVRVNLFTQIKLLTKQALNARRMTTVDFQTHVT